MSSASPKASKFLIIQHTLSPQKEKKENENLHSLCHQKKRSQNLTTKGRQVSVLLKKHKTEAHFTN
jgi:hypothetical protein